MLTKWLFSLLSSNSIMSSLILGLAALLAVLTMFHLLYGGDLMDGEVDADELPKNRVLAALKKFFKRFYVFNGKATGREWTAAIIAGFSVGIINYFTLQIRANTIWLAWVFLAMVLAGYIALTVLWVKGGTKLVEAAWFSVAALVMWFPAKTLSIMVTPIKFFWLLPTLVVIALVAFFFTDAISRRTDSPGLVWTLRAVAIVLIVLLLVTTLTGCSSPQDNNGDQSPSGGTAQPTTTWYKFYNLDLQKDKDTSNDFDFGPNPANKSWTAADYDREFRTRLKCDPALGAADMAWLDANVGTRYLGEFYESCKGNWAKTINAAAADWIEDPDGQVAYYRNLDAFFAFLDTGKVTIAEGGRDIEDQMYMNPYSWSASHAPDVIVMKTDQKDGLFLIYTFTIKGNEFQVKYRINCGYQPTNVEEVMGITPQDKPSKPSGGDTPTPTNPGDNPSPGPSPSPTNPPSPSPTNPPTPTYNKDPNKAPSENTEENDDKGPGPDTNNGVGATTSTQDNPNNSAYYDSYDDYRRDMDEMENINQNQRTGNDSNTPSSGGGSSTNVDNNADNGTGNGGINTPTPVQDSAQTSDGHNVTDDSPGEAWGGPPD